VTIQNKIYGALSCGDVCYAVECGSNNLGMTPQPSKAKESYLISLFKKAL